jgi:hypothetical protein
VLEAADSVGVQGPYARFCLWTSENPTSTTFVNRTVSYPASELGSLLRALLRRTREARLGVPRRARAGWTPLAYPHHLQVSLCVLGSREGCGQGVGCPKTHCKFITPYYHN